MLSVNLTKGEKVDLTKAVPSLKKVFIGAGWDMKKEGASMDADLSAFLLTDSSTVRGKEDFIYFNNKGSQADCVWHSGDNLTGEGDGDDEVINVDLTKVPDNIKKITFILNIYNAASKGQSLKDLENAFIRAVDAETNNELGKLEVKDLDGTTIIFAHLQRNETGWEFHADGATNGNDLGNLAAQYGLAA